ncbi:MAG: diguanylate cyclase [Acidobacteria bacterium]|nr:diguanylate cyclase [Acidobacteriota bacterium]
MKILIAEDDALTRTLLSSILRDAGHEVTVTVNGREALDILEKTNAPPLAVLDWMMPEMSGIDVCRHLSERKENHIYTIILTAKNRTSEVVEGLNSGADDYLVKPFDPEELMARIKVGARIIDLQTALKHRVIELEDAIVERDRAETALRQLALTDELTGLYNRRGFFTFAEHFLKLADRTGQRSLLFYADMDGLKAINDTYGHEQGSAAIQSVTQILRSSFRKSDIIGRIGGDEFVVLATNTGADDKDTVAHRLEENVRTYNAGPDIPHPLSISYGVVAVDPSENLPIESLIVEADRLMYEHKRRKKEAAN